MSKTNIRPKDKQQYPKHNIKNKNLQKPGMSSGDPALVHGRHPSCYSDKIVDNIKGITFMVGQYMTFSSDVLSSGK